MKVFKKVLSALSAFTMVFVLASCGGQTAQNPAPAGGGSTDTKKSDAAAYHIGIVTGTVAQSEDEFRAGQKAIELYGDAKSGGMIVHDTYPDNFMAEQDTTISKIVAMADDPLMKVVIVNQSVPGTVAAFKQIREKNPDIKLILITPQEDVAMAEEAADLVIDADNISRGYRIIAAAKKMGAKKFVHVSFPRHMSIETLALRRAIMEEAAKDLGIEFIAETSQDPMSDAGIPGAQQFIAENIPNWIEKYGKDTAFFCTNDAQTEPLLRGIAAGGAIFVEQDLPSPIMGYPGAFSIDLKDVAGDWQAINKKVEEKVVAVGGKDRMGSWAYSLGYSEVLGAVDLAKDVLDGKKELTKIEDVKSAIAKYTEGANWMGSYYVDRATGKKKENHILVAQDDYVYGKGYLGMDKVEVPEKYLTMNIDLTKIQSEK
ncbi:PF12683 family protein [Peptostreptococcaceae bacterium AS15]|nr:PF12683 family protein [Peptostreptococcaceae bacterium AS15]